MGVATDEASFFDEARGDAPLGTLLFRAGLVPDEALRDALEYSKAYKRRLGEVLLERALVSERDLSRIVAAQKGLQFVDLRKLVADPAAVRLVPENEAREWGALAIALEDGKPVVAVADPSNRFVFDRLTETLGLKPRFVAAVPGDLARALDAAYETARTVPPATESTEVGAADLPAPAPPPQAVATAHVAILLTNGERVPVSLPASRIEALEEARELIRMIDERAPGSWPLAEGRFLRPEAIVSVDVVDV
jgi:hypothetical protein